MTDKFTWTNEFGETLTVYKEADQIVIEHSDYPGSKLFYEKPTGFARFFAAMTKDVAVLTDEDGETIVLHKEEVDFIEATIKEQGW
ncbi:MAG: hypothetical protein HN413_17045 [Chloroflexi bacterium]|nr:hypothetical protein [Chloroflexota bacterium]